MYISTRVWVLRTPNAGRNGHFQRFLCKKTKKVFLGKKVHFFGNKTVDQPSGANLKKNCFLLKFAANFLLFKVFCIKNAENGHIQHVCYTMFTITCTCYDTRVCIMVEWMFPI